MSDKLSLWITLGLWSIALGISVFFLSSHERSPSRVRTPSLKRVAVIEISGVISYEGESGGLSDLSTSSALSWLEELNLAADDPLTGAIVLRINSPGGSVGATQEIHATIQRIREKGKPVVAFFGEIAASGGYYVATACDAIVSLPGTLTGSIGVIMQSFQYDELLKKIGVKPTVIKTGKNKDIMAGYRPMTSEEETILTELIHTTYEQFLSAVISGRNIPRETLLPLADGRIFTGEQALKYKLVDKLGTFEDAISTARELAKLPPSAGIYYPAEENFTLHKLFKRFSLQSFVRLPSSLPEIPHTKLWYYATF